MFSPSYPIETSRLAIRPFVRGDVEAVHAYRSRPDVARYLFDGPMTLEDCTEAVQQRVGQSELKAEGDKLILAVVLRQTGALVGEMALIWRSAAQAQGELGWIIHPDHQRRGYASEAANAMLGLGFGGLGLQTVTARCHAQNTASFRVMKRLGMACGTAFPHPVFTKGEWAQEIACVLRQSDWARATGQKAA